VRREVTRAHEYAHASARNARAPGSKARESPEIATRARRRARAHVRARRRWPDRRETVKKSRKYVFSGRLPHRYPNCRTPVAGCRGVWRPRRRSTGNRSESYAEVARPWALDPMPSTPRLTRRYPKCRTTVAPFGARGAVGAPLARDPVTGSRSLRLVSRRRDLHCRSSGSRW
jgi:hypothetical protein